MARRRRKLGWLSGLGGSVGRSSGFSGTSEEHEKSAKLARKSRAAHATQAETYAAQGQCRMALKQLVQAERADQRFNTHFEQTSESSGEEYDDYMDRRLSRLDSVHAKFVSACLRPATSGEFRGLGAMRRRRSRR